MNQLARSTPTPPESFGRYVLYPPIARGGMATVHTARLVGADGFTRLVAAKRLHPHFTDDPEFVTMFRDEAGIASRIHHPNVVPVLDVVQSGQELILVQEYVHGVPLSHLLKTAMSGAPIPVPIVVAIVAGVLAGLHSAHEVKDELGNPLEIIHRDVSPQNVMVSVDGIPRLLDFGIAKARTSTHHTREGVFKGKLAYMAPEQLRLDAIDRTVDLYATGVMMWELLVNRRIHDGRNDLTFVSAVVKGEIPAIDGALAAHRATIDEARWADLAALAPIVSRAMSHAPEARFTTAAEMMRALTDVCPPAQSHAVAEWVTSCGSEYLGQREKTLAANEESFRRTSVYPSHGSGMHRAVVPITSEIPVVHADSGAYPLPLRASALPPPSFAPLLARENERQDRLSPLWPFLGAGALIIGFAIVGVLREGDHESMPRAFSSLAPAPSPHGAVATAAPFVPSTQGDEAAQGAPPPSSVGAAPVGVAPVAAPAAVRSNPPAVFYPQQRVVAAPRYQPPPPPHLAPPPPLAPAPAPSAERAPPRTDCNPPFYFEGSKKIFKSACL